MEVPVAKQWVLVGLDVGEGTTEMMCACFTMMGTQGLLLGMLTLTPPEMWCFPGFSTTELLFLLFHTLCIGIKSPILVHIQERYVKLASWREGYQRICSYLLTPPQ